MATNNSKTTPYNALILLIAFVAYNIVLFSLSGFDNGAVFWISYGFVICAFLSWAICGNHLKTKTNQPRDWLFGYPIIRHCTIYTIVELIASIVFMAIDDGMGIGIPLAVQALILAVHAVFIISCFNARENIIEVQETVRKKVVYIDTLLANIDVVMAKTKDENVKNALRVLREEVRYSDTMSHESLAGLESQIAQTINMIDSSMAVNDVTSALKCCEKALELMKERNARCKVL